MKQIKRCKKHILSCLFVACFSIAILLGFSKINVNAETKTVKYEPNYTYSSELYVDSETQEKIAPEMEG